MKETRLICNVCGEELPKDVGYCGLTVRLSFATSGMGRAPGEWECHVCPKCYPVATIKQLGGELRFYPV